MKKKIALFIRGFHNGGIEKVFENYYSHMNLELFEIHIFTHIKNNVSRKETFERMGCIVHELSEMKGHAIKSINIREYRNLFKENHFDVVHNNMPDYLLPLYFAHKNKVPVRILHSHNVYGQNSSKKNILRKFFQTIEFHINSSYATKLLGVSQVAADAVFPHNSSKVEILYNAINLDVFLFNRENREKMRLKLCLDNKNIVLGHIGRYESTVKNQDFLIEVFERLYKNNNLYRLLLIGDGVLRSRLEEKVKELNLENAVIFTGNVSNVQDYLMAMDIFLLPSKQEGLGIVAVEAEATGLPCVVSDLVPREVKATNDVVFCPIHGEKSIEMWESEIMNTLPRKEFERIESNSNVSKAGFDINILAKRLENIYLS